jgi:hypothetical protein
MRGCIREHRFDSELQDIEANHSIAEEIISGIEWVLARQPDSGVNVHPSGVWYYVARDIPRQRQIIVFYTFTENHIYLLSALESKAADM